MRTEAEEASKGGKKNPFVSFCECHLNLKALVIISNM